MLPSKFQRVGLSFLLCAVVGTLSCDPDGDAGSPVTAVDDGAEGEPAAPTQAQAEVGQACTQASECGSEGAECVLLVPGSTTGICSFADCDTDGCPDGSTCNPLVGSWGSSVCLPDPDFCDSNCGSDLECSLRAQCAQAGCCGVLCPESCSTLTATECALMGATCPAECCPG